MTRMNPVQCGKRFFSLFLTVLASCFKIVLAKIKLHLPKFGQCADISIANDLMQIFYMRNNNKDL
jgi:hypothetical protein